MTALLFDSPEREALTGLEALKTMPQSHLCTFDGGQRISAE
jgi:hypothetical protein